MILAGTALGISIPGVTERKGCRRWARVVTQAGTELRVCTLGKTCKRQGSQQVAKVLRDLTAGCEPPITVTECGCLGNCGNGPNMVLLPAERVLSHVATADDAAEVLTLHCGVHITPAVLQATQLRLAGNAAAQEGNLEQAVRTYTQALALEPPYGRHLLYSNRSAALLQLTRAQEALEDAQAAVRLGPCTFTTGWVRLIDCLYALGRQQEAAEKLTEAEQRCPGFKQCPEYKSIVHTLRANRVSKR